VHLEEYHAGDGPALERALAVIGAAEQHDAPWHPATTARELVRRLRHGWDGEPERHFLAVSEGQVVAECSLFTSDRDNLDRVELDVTVAPRDRRQGHGSATLALLLAEVRRLGRQLVSGSGWVGTPAGAFAAAHGFRPVLREVVRRLDVDQLEPTALRAAHDEAARAAADYELVRLEGASPEAMLPELVGLAAAINDAPVDGMDYEDEVYSPDRVRAYELAWTENGDRLRRVVARCRSTGDLAGHTVVVVDAERPELAEQHDTAVLAAHRGHRLGLLLKAEMLCWLAEAEPQLRTIDTGNAGSNRFMIAVNERLGFRVVGEEVYVERRLDEPAGRPAG
jgi:RimJ/RimL family protein N-acetyltransferase